MAGLFTDEDDAVPAPAAVLFGADDDAPSSGEGWVSPSEAGPSMATKIIGSLLPMESRHLEGQDREYRPAIPSAIKAIPGAIKAIPEIPRMAADAFTHLQQAAASGDPKAIGEANAEVIPYQFGMGPATKLAVTAGKAVAAAGVARGVVNGVVPAAEAAVDAVKAIPKGAEPATSAVEQAARNSYKIVDESGLRISPESFHAFADGLQGKLKGFNSKLKSRAPETHGLLNDLRNYANEEDTIKFSELADLTSEIGDAAATASKNDKRLSRQIKDHVEEYIENLKPDDFDNVAELPDINAATSALSTGKDLWRKKSLMSDIDQIGSIASKKGFGKDITYIQRKFANLVEKPERMKAFTPEERGVIEKIAKTGKIESGARWLSPSGGLTGILHGGIGALTGLAVTGGNPIGAVAVPTAALGVRAGYNAARRARLGTLKNMIATEGEKPVTYIDRLRAQRAQRAAGRP